MTQLIIDENPLLIAPKLATIIGLNEAIVLQQIHYWINIFKQTQDEHHFQEGEWWVWNTGSEWQENFPFWSECTVRRVLDNLRNSYTSKENDKKVTRGPLVVVGNFNKKGYDQTLWYRVDYEEVARLEAILSNCENGLEQVEEMDIGKVSKPIPEITTKTSTEKELAPVVATASAVVPHKLTLDNYAERGYNKTEPIKVVHYPEDEEFTCPNPMCAEQVNWATLNKRKAVCPHCGQYLDGYEFGDSRPTWKPPRVAKKVAVIGDIIPRCPDKLADIMYYQRDKKTIELLLEQNREMLLDCLNWAVGKMAKGEMSPNKVAENAVKWMQKRLKASPEPEQQKSKKEVRVRPPETTSKLPSFVQPWHK